MGKLIASLLFAVSISRTAMAQTAVDTLTPSLPTQGERQAANIASWVTVGTAVAFDLRATLGQCEGEEQCYRALTKAGIRYGTVLGSTLILKKLFNRQRPCAADGCGLDDPNASMPSGHTAFAFSAIGGPRLQIALPLAFGTGGLRIAAGKHWLTDTLVGAGIGLAAGRIR